MINFCQISPTAHLDDFCLDNEVDLILAHLVEEDTEYANWYKNHKAYKILDNSAFEMYKQGRPMYDSSKLLEMGKRVDADVIVMSDYPGQRAQVTIDAAEQLGPLFHKHNFKTFFVPQSEIGDFEDYISAWEYAVNSDNVDFIGVSILGVPNAYGGIERDNKLQRFMSRWAMMNELNERGLLQKAKDNGKKLHFLGALDGWAGEVKLLETYHEHIFSWDSSQCVWHGLNGIKFDDSPTKLINGKCELEVDFSFETKFIYLLEAAEHNIKILKQQTKELT